jgi:hypothetical protein
LTFAIDGWDRRPCLGEGALIRCSEGELAMTTSLRFREELMATLAELGELFPDWRYGQLLANVATATRGPQPESIWDCEEEELLAAARRLAERNRDRQQVPA